ELGDEVAASLGKNIAVMMRGHGITTASGDVRSATIAACFLEESAGLQIRMLSAAGGDARRIRAFTAEEAKLTRDQTGPSAAAGGRAGEYSAAVAEAKPLGGCPPVTTLSLVMTLSLVTRLSPVMTLPHVSTQRASRHHAAPHRAARHHEVRHRAAHRSG